MASRHAKVIIIGSGPAGRRAAVQAGARTTWSSSGTATKRAAAGAAAERRAGTT